MIAADSSTSLFVSAGRLGVIFFHLGGASVLAAERVCNLGVIRAFTAGKIDTVIELPAPVMLQDEREIFSRQR